MSNKTISLSLKSDLNELLKLEDFVDEIVNESTVDEETAGSMMLLLSEAATNGILHGNKMDETKTVELTGEITDDYVIISITDQGAGFDPNKVPDPLKEENLLKTGGRGVYLMREYAHDVWYNDKGNQLKLTFKR